MTLDDRLNIFKSSQEELYSFLGVSRRDETQRYLKTDGLRHNHGSGNIDIPTAYPEILDYRTRQWQITESEGNSDEEIHVKIDNSQSWKPENTIRFNIQSIWDGQPEGVIGAAVSHLPKPDELHYAHPDEVERVEGGKNFYGDVCLLLLIPQLGESLLEDYAEYFE